MVGSVSSREVLEILRLYVMMRAAVINSPDPF